jgi:hypothetical protein
MKKVLIALLVSGCVIGEEYIPENSTGPIDPRELRPVPTNGLVLDHTLATQLPVTALGTRGADGEVVLHAATASAFAAPAGRDLLKYVATCALPAGEELVVGADRFAGFYGLAPEWATASCGTRCQHWVSACLLAHVNANGRPFPISLRGDHPGLRATPDAVASFTHQEAAFYGNVFQGRSHACFAAIGDDEQYLAGRICGQIDGGCGLVNTGPCTGDPLIQACERAAPAGGGFAECHTGKFTEYPRNSPVIREVVTVYLRP